MYVLPVLDVMNGVVVRGVAGRRKQYRPIVSRLTSSTQPLDVARAFREHFGLSELYVADLDAIAGQPPALEAYAALRAHGFCVAIDAGIRRAVDGEVLAATDIEAIVAGLETLAGPEELTKLCRQVGGSRVVFSLDLKDGRPLGNLAAWQETDPLALASRAVACGVRRLIVLDLARVGVGSGTGTEDLCRSLALGFPNVEVLAGGGIHSAADLERLRQCGVAGVLIASALHDGRLSRANLSGP
jgi:phosphoribosylformimino-5-aminoimidazole carboxamide ribotide isomerase